MTNSEARKLQARLLALDIKLAELDHQMRASQVRIQQLEAHQQDSRLARILGEEHDDPGAVEPRIEEQRRELARQAELAETVRAHQREVRVEYALWMVNSRRETVGASDEGAESDGGRG